MTSRRVKNGSVNGNSAALQNGGEYAENRILSSIIYGLRPRRHTVYMYSLDALKPPKLNAERKQVSDNIEARKMYILCEGSDCSLHITVHLRQNHSHSSSYII